MENIEEKIYEMKLHDQIQNNDLLILRVPGGWIYNFYKYEFNSQSMSSVFVPFNTEFMNTDDL